MGLLLTTDAEHLPVTLIKFVTQYLDDPHVCRSLYYRILLRHLLPNHWFSIPAAQCEQCNAHGEVRKISTLVDDHNDATPLFPQHFNLEPV